MCGRFTLRTPTPVLSKAFRVSTMPELQPRYNVAPTQQVAVVRTRHDSPAREMINMQWGLVPYWAKDTKIAYRTINARSETAADKPAFRAAFRSRRCLVVADGYYEWEKVGKKKLPHFIRMQDEVPFGMAGLWEIWKGGPDADNPLPNPLLSCTILTTDSNELTSHLHDRMPVILSPDDWDLWLDPELDQPEPLLPLLRPYPSDEMQQSEVSTFVNNARHEGPECLEVQRELF